MLVHRLIRTSVAAVMFSVGAAHALERAGEVPASDTTTLWDSASTCAVTYENACTDWRWRWSVGYGDKFGVIFDPCCDGAILDATLMDFSTSGWGYSGIIDVATVDENGCAGSPLASRWVWHTGGALLQNWGVPCDGPVLVTFHKAYSSYPAYLVSDHPAAGSSGPPACGYCYPATRVTHSFYFGTTSSPLCPGSPLNDGVCNAELRWTASFSCLSPVEDTTWAAIKSLYR